MSRTFDLALIDLLLTGMGGAELAKTAREKGSDTPMVCITGSSPDPEIVRGAGFVRLLMRPINQDELLSVVAAVISETVTAPQ